MPCLSLVGRTICRFSLDPTGSLAEDSFQAGTHRRLISCLNQLPGFSAIPRYTVMTLPGSGITLPEFAAIHSADAFLEWDSRTSDDSTTLSLNLYRASGEEEWLGAAEFSLPTQNQSELCTGVADGLMGRLRNISFFLRSAFRAKPDRIDPEVQSAYDLGLFSLEERSAPAFERAALQFGQAIALDSAFAPAYAGLVIAKSMQAMFYFESSEDVYPIVRSSAEKAMALDEDLAEAHLADAFVKYLFEWDWEGAETSVQAALSLDGHSLEALLFSFRLLRSLGRVEEALVYAERAKELNPYDRRARVSWARILADAGRLEESLQEHREVLSIWPDWTYGLMFMGQSYQENDELREAARIYRDLYRAYEENPDPPPGFGDIAFFASVFAQVGEHALAERILDDLMARRAAGEFVASDAIAWILGGLGRMDEAMLWLTQAYQEGEHGMIHLISWQCFDPFRSDPRFQALARTVFGERANH